MNTLWEKEKMLVKPAFSPFPTMFSILSMREINTLAKINLTSANDFNFVWSKFLLFGQQLTCRGNFCELKNIYFLLPRKNFVLKYG